MGATRRPAPVSTADTLCSPSERIKFLRRCRSPLSRFRTSAPPNARDVDVTEAGGIAPNPLYWPGELEGTGHGPPFGSRHLGERRQQALRHPAVHLVRNAVVDVLGAKSHQRLLQPLSVLQMLEDGDEGSDQHLFLFRGRVAAKEGLHRRV